MMTLTTMIIFVLWCSSQMLVISLKVSFTQPFYSSGFEFRSVSVKSSNLFVNPIHQNLPGKVNLEGNDSDLRKDLNQVIQRLDKLEKTLITPSYGKYKTPVGNLIDSIAASTFDLNPKNIELCSIISFFLIGVIIGWSLLDRLWLIGGIWGAFWASNAVNQDTRGGIIARSVGVTFAQYIRDLHEKYHQLVIFYRTGQLAYMTSKTWDSYDKFFGLSARIEAWKRLAVQRAIDFNSAFNEYHLVHQLSDAWDVMLRAPDEAMKMNEKYGVTSSITAFTRGIISLTSDFFEDISNRGRSPSTETSSKRSTGWRFWNRQKKQPVRINPWQSPFQSLECYQKPKRKGFRSKFNMNIIPRVIPQTLTRLNSHSLGSNIDMNDVTENIPMQNEVQAMPAKRTIACRSKQLSPFPSISSMGGGGGGGGGKGSGGVSDPDPLKALARRVCRWRILQIIITLKLKLKFLLAGVISPVGQYSSKEEALHLWRLLSIRGLVREHVYHSLF